MRTTMNIATFLIISLIAFPGHACDVDTGERQQHVFLSWNGQQISEWMVTNGEMQQISLPNGFELGVSLDEPGPDVYEQQADRNAYVWELVEIKLFDLSAEEPQLLSRTYGGTNSRQGFGARGGANRVSELGDPGILLTLLKPVCLESKSVAAAP
ncbi:MAG: hypothetical protein ACLFSC_02195 [Wenzhouxiangella sp.]